MLEALFKDERRRDRLTAAAILLFSFIVYNANFRIVGAGDTYPARTLPFAIWKAGSLEFSPVLGTTVQGHPNPYWLYPTVDGRPASLYPIVTPILITPLYAPAVGYLALEGWPEGDLDRLSWLMEKISASFVTSLAVALFFLVLRRRLGWRDALLLTCVLAFGTNTWSTSSQALWLHGVSELCSIVALWALTGEVSPGKAALAGAAIALIACNRPQELFLAIGLAAYGFYWARRRLLPFILGGLIPGLLVLGYNLKFFAHPLGAYGAALLGGRFFSWKILPGIAGLLVSPGRGLFVYSPVLLFLPVFFMRVFRDRSMRLFALCLTAGLVLQVIFYGRTDWRAGRIYGPRFLLDSLPVMVWLMAPIVASLKRTGRIVLAALLVVSIAIQYIGAFRYNGQSNVTLFATADPFDVGPFWKPKNAQFLIEARNPPAPRGLVFIARSLGTPPPAWMKKEEIAEPNHAVLRCRVIDTRSGIAGPPVVSHKPPRFFGVNGRCGIPADATSVTGFLTVVDASEPGRLMVGSHSGNLRPAAPAVVGTPATARVTVPLVAPGGFLTVADLDHPGTLNVVFEVDGYRGKDPSAPLPPSACRVRWDRHTMSSPVAAKSTVLVSLTLTNLGDRTWPDVAMADPVARSGQRAVRLQYAWHPAGSEPVPESKVPKDLPRPVRPGETITFLADVLTPPTPGEYQLVFELLQESGPTFTAPGSGKLVIPVSVQ